MKAARDGFLNPALSLAMCAAAAALCVGLRMPLPWMIGPLLAMAACNFGGARLRAPQAGRAAGQVVIGTALGLYFTPLVGREVVAHWPLLFLAAAIALLVALLGAYVLRLLGGVDARTAFFASVPGGAAEMAILGERYRARVDRIALAQSLRILVVVIAVPFALTYSGAHGEDVYEPVAAPFRMPGMLALLAAAFVAALLLHRARMPNAFFFGPLAAGIALTVNDVQLSSLPVPLTNAAQLLIGCALGTRFERRSLESAPRYVSAVLASVSVAMLVAAGLAWGVARASGLSVPSLILAMAPGGIAEMCITAQVLQLGVPLVTAAHVVRVGVLVIATGPAFQALSALRRRVRIH
jgi:membrane AbrB-like protein